MCQHVRRPDELWYDGLPTTHQGDWKYKHEHQISVAHMRCRPSVHQQHIRATLTHSYLQGLIQHDRCAQAPQALVSPHPIADCGKYSRIVRGSAPPDPQEFVHREEQTHQSTRQVSSTDKICCVCDAPLGDTHRINPFAHSRCNGALTSRLSDHC
jgi:hypothetical protein